MIASDIKPIPKYLLAMVQKYDQKLHSAIDGHLRFYAYLAIWKGELVKVTVAVKYYKKLWRCKQVAVHGVNSERCLVKDLEYCGFAGMGYRVGWYAEGLAPRQSWWENTDWCSADDRYYDPNAQVVNIDLIDKLPEYKYSEFRRYSGVNILKFLRLYSKYPSIEYLMKLGLERLVFSKMILSKASCDMSFCRWLGANKDKISLNYYDIAVILRVYKLRVDIDLEQARESSRKSLRNDKTLAPIRELFKLNLEPFFRYIHEQNTRPHTYLDYLVACEYLGLDMSVDMNKFPHDFKRWHDIRIDEYASAKASKDELERKEMYTKFANISSKYSVLENMLTAKKTAEFVVIIAKSPADLIREGEELHHCVGRMNYDQKFIREETLIFFIRDRLTPTVPLATVEYSLQSRKILQCYGDSDSKPEDSVMEFVNKKWLPYANKQVKKLQQAA